MKFLMMNDLISIIIPVYNAEQYLRHCLDSVINQTYRNLEIILIDDGSTDNSSNICDDYKKQDSRIIVVHKNNGGQSAARNDGISISSGKYIAFVDSDDYVACNYIEELHRLLSENNADISQIANKQVYNSEQDLRMVKSNVVRIYNQKDAIASMLCAKEFNDGAWGKLFKKNIFESISFPVGKIYEDLAVAYDIFLKCKILVFGNAQLYFYLQRNNSTMNSAFSMYQYDEVSIVESSTKKVENIYPDLKKMVAYRCVNSYFAVLYRILLCSNKKDYLGQRKELKIKIMSNKKMLLQKWNTDKAIKTKIRLLSLGETPYFLFQKAILKMKRKKNK